LRRLYDLTKLGPTSANTCPMRVVFVKSAAAKERLKPALAASNVEKTMAAPVCAIIAWDSRFHEHIPRLFPHNPAFANLFTKPGQEEYTRTHAFRNGTLQGAYFILAARALGLDAGPMSGFDNAKVDAEFFPDGRYKSNFLVSLGHGDPTKLHPRLPRLEFDEVCAIV
jgi:3-hydroxypropanoate dehydrogenase